MKRIAGDPSYPIWLLGDSNPRNWEDRLETPLDPRHPARHSIWTPIADAIQDEVFRARRRRLNTKDLYIRNAIASVTGKPDGNCSVWADCTQQELLELRRLIREHKPFLLLSFGAFAFEFARRALEEVPSRRYDWWGARRLGEEFRRRVSQVSRNGSSHLLPLLHASISRGRFIESHDQYCNEQGANYFDCIAAALARLLLEQADHLAIWI